MSVVRAWDGRPLWARGKWTVTVLGVAVLGAMFGFNRTTGGDPATDFRSPNTALYAFGPDSKANAQRLSQRLLARHLRHPSAYPPLRGRRPTPRHTPHPPQRPSPSGT